MYIGKIRNSDFEEYDLYLEELSAKTIVFSKYLTLIGIPLLAFFIYQDFFVVELSGLFRYRLIFIFPYILYMISIFVVKSTKRIVVEWTHSFLLLSLLLMSVGMINYTISLNVEIDIYSRGALGALIVNTFVVFTFAGISSRWLHLIIGVPNIMLIFTMLTNPNLEFRSSLLFLSNFIFIAILLTVRAFYQEYVHFDEFKSRYKYKKELEKNIDLNKELRLMATIDEMTGVYTRNVGIGMIDIELKKAQRDNTMLTLCYIDVDGLKKVNDLYGHAIGDKYLQKIVEVLKNVIRASDFIVRMGGDEFIIVFYDCNPSKAKELITKAHTSLRDSNCPFNCDFSFGVSSSNGTENNTVDKLIKLADTEMYIQKNKKKELK
ncbi:MAG: GGDEF domain-containing protein [Clostridiales bacterium]|nr:GGDEF domain-containing protein [Clostridiales bacterium]